MSLVPFFKRSNFLLLLCIVLIFFVINISLGSVLIPPSAIWDIMTGDPQVKSSWVQIILNYRLPKAFTAILVGSGLGVSGLMMQTLFRNPMAGPFVLGVSSGASLGVAILIMGASIFGSTLGVLLVTKLSLMVSAILGSFVVLLLVLLVAHRMKDTMALLIIGLMFGSITSAFVSVLAYFAPAEGLQQYIFWGFGSLGNLNWSEVLLLGIVCITAILLCVRLLKSLNALLLGENYAQSLGIDIKTSRNTILIATSLLAGSITAFAGPIAFVGLAIPHFARLIFRTADHRILLPGTLLCGSLLLLVCDTIAQLPASSYTLPINAITSIFGAPVVIWLLVRKRNLLF